MANITAINRNTYLINADSFDHELSSDWFEASYWQSKDAVSGESKGRNTTYFIQHNDLQMVLRHYYRGGLYGKLNNDRYWFSGAESTRAYQELKLLETLSSFNLPAPKPIAARVQRHLMFYRADILIEKIPNAVDVFHRLRSNRLSSETWQSIGQTIRLFHDHNVYHSDLNIHNIMCDKDSRIYLIDFDKCEIKREQADPTKNNWREKNLQRLHRSLTKEKNKYDQFFWENNDWQHLITGYKTSTL